MKSRLFAAGSFHRLLILTFVLLTGGGLRAALVSYWNFDNSGSIGADSGGANTMTAFNGAAYTATGKTGGGLVLNGTNQYLGPAGGGGAAISGLPIGNSPYSLVCWMNPTAVGDRGMIGWGTFGAGRQVNAFRLYVNGTNGFRHYWWSADLDSFPSPTYSIGTWAHCAATYDGTIRRIYLNGVQIAQDTPGVNGSTNNNFRIGSTNNGEYFAGTLDDVAVFNAALSAAEVAALANGSRNPLTVANSVSVTSFTATPLVFLPGQDVKLTWATNQATSVAINQNVGTVANSGTVTLSPTVATTYTITAQGVNGPVSANVTVTPYPLSTAQILHRWSFDEAAGTDILDSVGTAHGSIKGTGWTRSNGEVQLPGGASNVAPYIDLPNGLISSLNDLTVEGWMTLPALPAGQARDWQRIFDFGTADAGEITDVGLPVGITGSTGYDYILLSAQIGPARTQKLLSMRDNNSEQNVAENDSIVDGQSFHFAVTYSATGNSGQPQMKYYKNGTLVGTPLNTSFRLQNMTDNNNWLGRSQFAGDSNTLGNYNEFRIWNGAMSANEVANSAAAGPQTLPAAQILAFSALSPSIEQGQSVRLSYVLTDTPGATASINQGAPAVVGTSGYVTVSPTATTTYTLTLTSGAIVRTAQTSVTVLVTAPTVYDRAVRVGYNQPGTVAFAATDPNTPLASLTYTVVAPPAHGQVTGTGATRTYTPDATFTGTDTFTYLANDGLSNSNTATVTLTVSPAPAAPTALTLSSNSVATTAGAGSYIGDFSTTDVNFEDTFAYALVGGAGSDENGNFSISGRQLRAAASFSALAGVTQHIRVQVTDSGGQTFQQTFTLSVTAPVRGVVINEFLYNPLNNTNLGEFIELYNNGAATVSLSGWRLSGAVDYIFPAGTSIAAGGYLLIAENPAAFQTRWAKTALGPWDGSLSSDGEVIRLRDATDATVCAVDYKVGFPWPISPDGEGTSVELINPALDPSLGSNWRPNSIPLATATQDTGSPGLQNVQFSTNAPPAIRKVDNAPAAPSSQDPIVVTALVSDPDGVQTVELQYQIVLPGTFISSTVPRVINGGQFAGVDNTTPNPPLAANAAFESAANWTTIPMSDAGGLGDAVNGDGIYTATIPAQANRTLVRYRVKVTDNLGANVRVPYADDASLNFACFVYNGVPDYDTTPSSDLTKLPVYHFLTQSADYVQAIADADHTGFRLTGGTPSWSYENWEAAFVYDGKVYDHMKYRLHGANGRYAASGNGNAGVYGKRAFKFVFNKGYYFEGRDNDGKKYPTSWKTMITEKNLWENKGTQTFSLNEVVNFRVWNLLGIPSPLGNWAHFRTVKQAAEQPDLYFGDFWGLMFVHEDYDKQFLDAHDLPGGNLYKLTRDDASGIKQQRYQAPLAVTNGGDHDEIQNQLKGTSSNAFITSRVNLDLWCRYHAFAEAVRHYDYWPNGDNNAAWYFYPNYNVDNGNKGVMWLLPSDVDATWGPTWNNGHDIVHNSLFNDSGDSGGDSATHPELWPRYYAQVREVRDLLWQQDQVGALIDELADVIKPFVNADYKRWVGAPNAAGNHNGFTGPGVSSPIGQTSLAAYVTDMKNFAFVGGSWAGGDVGAGGRAAFLDAKQAENGESAAIPSQPTITYIGGAGFPVNDLRFQTSAFADPQGAGTFGALQWRIAEVNVSPTYIPGEKRLLEIVPRSESGNLMTFAATYRFPSAACEPGKRYRARVRHIDDTGRPSKWSAAVEFTASTYDPGSTGQQLVVSELMYHSANPTVAEKALPGGSLWTDDDFDYIELRNIGATSVDLSDIRFSSGVDFTFPAGTTLGAGQSTLVVQNVAAFQARYGTGKPIAGTWQAVDKLKNSSEEIILRYGDLNPPLIQFTYDEVAPWPTTPDGTGPSLVLIHPESHPDMALGSNWRASFATTPGGNPGGDDRPTYAAWALANGGGDPEADTDGDGLTDLLEFALGGLPNANSQGILPQQAVQNLTVSGTPGDYLTLTFSRLTDPADITYTVQFAATLPDWLPNGVLVSSTVNANGTTTETWRAPQPMSAANYFGRVKVVK